LELRLAAIEYFLGNLAAMFYRERGLTTGTVEAMHQRWLDGVRIVTFPGDHPAVSDLLSAEFELALSSLLHGVREIWETAKTPPKPQG
jgi:hypothetical protein